MSRRIVARQSTKSSSNGDDGGSFPLTFVFRAKGDCTDPDASSPRLWKTPESVSPNSRAEAIERGQRELMEMIKDDLPESLYELSLKDIVEQDSSNQICLLPDRDSTESDDEKRHVLMADLRKRKKKAKKAIPKSRSFDSGGGYLLKTSVFPIWFGMKRKKKKAPEKDWWRTRSIPHERSRSQIVDRRSQIEIEPSPKKDWWRTRSDLVLQILGNAD